jgi:hypothetical protein
MRRPQVAATSWSESNQWPYLGCCICGMTNCTNWSTPCTMHDLCALVGPKEYLENIMTKIIQIILEKRFFVVWFLSHKSMPATSPYHIPVHPIVVYTCIPVRQLWLRYRTKISYTKTVKWRFPKSCGYPKSSMSGDYDSVLKTMVIWESTHPKMWTTQSSFINVYPHRPHIAPKPYTVDDGLVPYRWWSSHIMVKTPIDYG